MTLSRFRYVLRAALLVPVLLVSLQGCASLIVKRGLTPPRSDERREKSFAYNRSVWEHLMPGITAWTDSLRRTGAMRDTFITREGVRLHACYVPARGGVSKHTAVVVHGYLSSPYNVMMLARMYVDSIGFNVLMPTLRYHGYSGGESIQMGWNDRLDVLRWSEEAHGIFNDTLQVLHGISMGGATVMMASGEETPGYVRGFVEDCGYSSVWNELVYALDHYAGLRAAPTGYRVERLVKRRFGWNVGDASSVSQLSKCEKPFLFIHGEKDTFVPSAMVEYNFNAKAKGYREMWVAPGSKHARSYPDHPQEYVSLVRNFIYGHVL